MATDLHEQLHFSTCLPRNDLCTAEPQTIIYSSPTRTAVHEARVRALRQEDPNRPVPPIRIDHPPSKRSLAPLTEVHEFVTRFCTYHKSTAAIQTTNPQPNRPTSSSSQSHNDDERLTRASYNVYLHAPRPLIQRGRGDILQHLKLHHQTIISAPRELLFDKDNVFPPAYADELDKIAIDCVVEIIVAVPSSQNFTIFSNKKKNALRRGYLGSFSELKEGTDDLIIVLNGSLPSLESGRVRLLVLLDRMQGRVCEVMDGIKHDTHPLLAGRRCFDLEENIEKAFKVKLYMHAPTVKVFKDDPLVERHYDRIYVTGEPADVHKAVAALQTRNATLMTLSKDVVLHGSKIDWIITEKLEKLREIMEEDATFISLPPLGTESTVITVTGCTLPLIERSIRRMNKLISDYFQFTYIVLPDATATLEPPCSLPALAWCTGAEVNFSGNCFEINGNDNAIRILLDLLIKGEFTFYPQYPYRVRIRCEMANELQEFVAGKKSGKVNKIMKTTNCNIAFESYTEYNFLIDIMAPQLEEILEGYKQLLEEFPAELYWFVPEEYHKRIIGVQGKTIQRIMKHYSVYVKFFNALEFAASGGDSKTEDNVLARTPAKNQHALDECKKAVLEMVFQNDKDYITETVEIPKVYHAVLQKQCQTQLQDISKNSGATIRFPEQASTLDAVAITAAPTRIKDVAKNLLNLVPMTFTLTGDDPKLVTIVASPDFNYQVIDHNKVLHQIDMTVVKDRVATTVSPPRTQFQFQYLRTHFDQLKKAVEVLCRYVAERGANLQAAIPPEPQEPETKPFDQEKSNYYGQGSVTQPYHTPAQIAAAAQGTLHAPFHQHNMNFHQNGSSAMYHQGQHINQHGQNGFHGHHQQQQNFGRGYPQGLSNNFAPNRGHMNGNRHGNGHHGSHFQQGPQQGYPPPFLPQGGSRGGGPSHINPHAQFNPPFAQGGGMNPPMNGATGFQRRGYVHTPPTPSEKQSAPSPINYQQIPRNVGMIGQSPLDTMNTIDVSELSGPANGNGGNYRHAQEGHTPTSNGVPYNSNTPSQSYFSPQQQHNGYPHKQGYNGGHAGSRFQ